MQNFVQVTVRLVDSSIKEQLIALFSLIKFDGFEENDNNLIAYVEENLFNPGDVGTICKLFNLDFTKTIIPQQNWNALWESNFEPVVVDDFCAIRADFHTPFTNTEHEIIITPKMSFGTGHHATTYIMIQQMRELDIHQKKVADFGTGTGILAIMAEKLGAAKIIAIDYDEWSIENANENIQKNNCALIEVFQADHFSEEESFDLILANINKNVIIANLEEVIKGLAPGGKLLLSGLLKQDEKEVIEAFTAKQLRWVKTVERNNWIGILLEV